MIRWFTLRNIVMKKLFSYFADVLAIVAFWRLAENYNSAHDLISPLGWKLLDNEAAVREIEKAIKDGKDIQVDLKEVKL